MLRFLIPDNNPYNGLMKKYQHPAVYHCNVIKWKHFPRQWPFERGIHRSPVDSPHKGQSCVFDLRLNKWLVNNRDAGDLSRHHAHYDVTVMS